MVTKYVVKYMYVIPLRCTIPLIVGHESISTAIWSSYSADSRRAIIALNFNVIQIL